jgi:hypothetical protein
MRLLQGVAVSDAEMATVNIKRQDFHGNWNYTHHTDHATK